VTNVQVTARTNALVTATTNVQVTATTKALVTAAFADAGEVGSASPVPRCAAAGEGRP
jgi:hypothetical protein